MYCLRSLLLFISLTLCALTSVATEKITLAKAPSNTSLHTVSALTPDTISNRPPPTETKRLSNLHSLQDAYNRYITLANEGAWQPIPQGKSLSFTDQHIQVPLLREKLIKLGDHPPVDCEQRQDPLFDIDLHEALVHFQTRHGDEADGILGPKTRRQLNVSPSLRAEQLKVNIARIKRFIPNSDRFIHVNIPEFRLYLYEQNNAILSMKTIVGKKKRKTPVFDSQINRIVVNPSWYVPKSIAYRDIIPALKKDPSYLTKVNLKVVSGWGDRRTVIADNDIDYDKLYIGKNYQRFWEAPSEGNTLGQVKFLTNSTYAIYLHDTSAKRLFSQNKRAFSSGCIRLEQPRKLADELMRMTHGWKHEQLDPIFAQTSTQTFTLAEPIPLHVTYWTAWADPEGTINFRDDIYKQDRYALSTRR